MFLSVSFRAHTTHLHVWPRQSCTAPPLCCRCSCSRTLPGRMRSRAQQLCNSCQHERRQADSRMFSALPQFFLEIERRTNQTPDVCATASNCVRIRRRRGVTNHCIVICVLVCGLEYWSRTGNNAPSAPATSTRLTHTTYTSFHS